MTPSRKPIKWHAKSQFCIDSPTGKLAYPMGNHAKPAAARTPKEAAAVAMMHTPDEICTMATAYKAKVQDGKIKRADWAHFCGLCGECLEDMQRAISGETSEQIDGKAWAAEGDRQRVVHALKVLSTFIRGEYSTSNAWNGAMSQKAMFNMRQNWDGQAASTEADRKAGGGEITVRLVGDFGGVKDPFK